jgi:hypothetical protein
MQPAVHLAHLLLYALSIFSESTRVLLKKIRMPKEMPARFNQNHPMIATYNSGGSHFEIMRTFLSHNVWSSWIPNASPGNSEVPKGGVDYLELRCGLYVPRSKYLADLHSKNPTGSHCCPSSRIISLTWVLFFRRIRTMMTRSHGPTRRLSCLALPSTSTGQRV